jgi:hypothetical protein
MQPETVVMGLREGHSDLILIFGIAVQEGLNFNFERFAAGVIATKGPTSLTKESKDCYQPDMRRTLAGRPPDSHYRFHFDSSRVACPAVDLSMSASWRTWCSRV